MSTSIYLSGRFTVDADVEKAWLSRTGCKHRCFSFAFVGPLSIPGQSLIKFNPKVAAALKVCEDQKINIMMDSGAHSLHGIERQAIAKRTATAKAKQKFDINELRKYMFDVYCAYCRENKHKWAFYVTLDFRKKQEIIYQMQKDFEREGLAPTPVYHGDSSIDWLRKHKDMGHDFVCIGGATFHPGKGGLDYYFDKVFNFGAKHGMEFHGLAFTSLDIIMSWPFRSIDSSTWSRTAAFGMILIPDVRRRKFLNLHISDRRSSNQNSHLDMSSKQKDKIAELLKFHGFDLKAMHKSEVERHDWNGYVMSNLDKFDVMPRLKRRWESLL